MLGSGRANLELEESVLEARHGGIVYMISARGDSGVGL